MAILSKIKASDNVEYNIRDDYFTWGGKNLLPQSKWSPAPEDIARFIGNKTIELYG